MANFVGDGKPDGTIRTHANSMWRNFVLDLTGYEHECVWKNRAQLERYFLVVAVAFCWTLVVPLAKLRLYAKSRAKKDHR